MIGYIHFHPDGTADVTRKSPLSGAINTRTLDITFAQMTDYDNGSLVQDAFPHLSAADREFILTGITPFEWHASFGDPK